jgi:hypothetical protein
LSNLPKAWLTLATAARPFRAKRMRRRSEKDRDALPHSTYLMKIADIIREEIVENKHSQEPPARPYRPMEHLSNVLFVGMHLALLFVVAGARIRPR